MLSDGLDGGVAGRCDAPSVAVEESVAVRFVISVAANKILQAVGCAVVFLRSTRVVVAGFALVAGRWYFVTQTADFINDKINDDPSLMVIPPDAVVGQMNFYDAVDYLDGLVFYRQQHFQVGRVQASASVLFRLPESPGKEEFIIFRRQHPLAVFVNQALFAVAL